MFGAFGTTVLALMTALMLYTPVAQYFFGREVDYEVMYSYPVFVYFWYMRLKPINTLAVAEGEVTFANAFGKKRVPIDDLQAIRPFLNVKARDFVLEHRRGNELLFDDPTTVALFVADILARNPNFRVRGVPALPTESPRR
jgi:hypothetical protein